MSNPPHIAIIAQNIDEDGVIRVLVNTTYGSAELEIKTLGPDQIVGYTYRELFNAVQAHYSQPLFAEPPPPVEKSAPLVS